jgi:ferrous iron transport protein B
MSAPVSLAAPARRFVVALVGNPNTGKTTLFNALSGLRQHVGNYPGVTVEIKKGHTGAGERALEVVDLPGTYSLAPRSPDEMLAVDLILGRLPGERHPDVILSIVDASNLERNLYLTTQVMELGIPVVVALNMTDIAEGQGIRIDADKLSKHLGTPVVAIQANRKKGLAELKRALALAAEQSPAVHGPRFPEAFEGAVTALQGRVGADTPPFLVRRMLLDVGGSAEMRAVLQHGKELLQVLTDARKGLIEAGCPVPAVEARTRYAWIRQALTGCVQRPSVRPVNWTDRLDRILTHRVWGTLVFLTVLFLVFQSLFTWAKPFMRVIAAGKDLLAEGIRGTMAPGPMTSLLADGVVEGVGSVLVFLPQIIILFGFMAILEDCGYMARAAYLMDRLMSRCGLSGKSFIPLLSSVACAVPGIMATRVIEQRRDRLATILVAPLMSCSARLPVYTLLIATFLTTGYGWWVPGLTLFCLYLLGFVAAPLIALLLKRTLLRGETPVFVMEMPLYKWPSAKMVVRRMYDSGWAFMRRAGTMILASMVVVWALLYFPNHNAEGQAYDDIIAEAERTDAGEEFINQQQQEWKANSLLGRAGRALEPAFAPLGWDWRIGTATLASFPAREVVVGTLGIIYKVGRVDSEDIMDSSDAGDTPIGKALQPEYNVPVALSVMVFFALCCQCASTLAVIRRETNTWRWPAFTFVYMTVLAYVAALVVYQVGRWVV